MNDLQTVIYAFLAFVTSLECIELLVVRAVEEEANNGGFVVESLSQPSGQIRVNAYHFYAPARVIAADR
jgi:hypothetical protein